MPITAKLSRRFYEQFGDDIVNELINLLNTVDATSRSDLREINELNFARFDAKVEQRFAEAELKLEQRIAGLAQRIADLRAESVAMKSELIKWMFLCWTGSALVNLLVRR